MASLLRANALAIPLRDASVDLVVTSPPYFALRSYQDGGEHYANQIGSEDTPAAFLAALWAVLDECWRVLKPTGSVFVNLGDKYARNGGGGKGSSDGLLGRGSRPPSSCGTTPEKSLMLLPEQFRLGAIDPAFRQWKSGVGGPQWIARSVVIWDKPNGLPESVADRVRRSHEDWVHLTKQPRYFAAVDEIREPHGPDVVVGRRRSGAAFGPDGRCATGDGSRHTDGHPLGKLPGSVWEIPSEPLKVPDWLGVDHFAAYPQEWPRKLILGWSPSGYCTACDEPRRATVEKKRTFLQSVHNGANRRDRMPGKGGADPHVPARDETTITGYACGCDTPDAPTRPAVVLDPFGGTGTTAMVARALGRHGVHLDLSADYLRLARWRIHDSGHAAKTMRRTNEERQVSLFS